MTRERAEAIYLSHLKRNSGHTVIANGDGTYIHTFSHAETAHVGIRNDARKYRSVLAIPTERRASDHDG